MRSLHWFALWLLLALALPAGAAPAAVALRVAGEPVEAAEALFWLRQAARHAGPDAGRAQLQHLAVESIRRHRAILARAQALGLRLSAADLQAIAARRDAGIRAYGGPLAYLAIVRRMYVSEDVLERLARTDLLGQRLFERMYGAGGERCSDADVADYVAALRLQRAKFIRVAAGEGRRELMQSLAERLDRVPAGADAEALFDRLAAQYGEDARMADPAQDRLFAAGSLGEAVDRAYAGLAPYRHSGVVDDVQGAQPGHLLLLRLPIDPESRPGDDERTLRHRAAYDHLFKRQVEDWAAALPVELAPAFDAIAAAGLNRQGEPPHEPLR